MISKKNNLGTKAEQIELKKFKKKKNKRNIKIVEEKGKKYAVIPGEPYYYTAQNVDVFINGLGEDKNVGEKTLELLEKYKDKRFFFSFILLILTVMVINLVKILSNIMMRLFQQIFG